MNAASDYSPYLEHLDFDEIVERDVRGVADEQEREYLRAEENLSEWRSALGSLNTSMDNRLATHKQRLAEREKLYENHPDNPQIQRAYLEHRKEYEDAKQWIKQRKEVIQQRLEENKSLRRKRHSRLMAGTNHRDLLIQARRFLATDEAIAYSYLPARDDLLAEIDHGLYGEEAEEASE